MKQSDRAEKISITLPHDMLVVIKHKVETGEYASTSEVIREAMRLWQKQEDKHKAELDFIRHRIEKSAQSGSPVPLEQAFDEITALHHNKQ